MDFKRFIFLTTGRVKRVNVHTVLHFVLLDPTVAYSDMTIIRFFKMANIRHLDLLCACLDYPRGLLGGLYDRANFTIRFGISTCAQKLTRWSA